MHPIEISWIKYCMRKVFFFSEKHSMTVNTIWRPYTNKTGFFQANAWIMKSAYMLVYYSKSEINTSLIKSFISLCQVLLFFLGCWWRHQGSDRIKGVNCFKIIQLFHVFRTDHLVLDNQLVYQGRKFSPLSEFLSFL